VLLQNIGGLVALAAFWREREQASGKIRNRTGV
jgi:hypothetical protein